VSTTARSDAESLVGLVLEQTSATQAAPGGPGRTGSSSAPHPQVTRATDTEDFGGASSSGASPFARAEDVRLGRLLVEMDLVRHEELQAALTVQDNGQRLGEILVERGSATPEGIDAALQRQTVTGGQIGGILVRAGAITKRQLAGAVRLQARLRRRLGDILVSLGALTRRQLNFALRIQKTLRLLFASMTLVAAMGCATVNHDYRGRPVPSAPFDGQYRQVERLLERAHAFEYRPEPTGQDKWQLPDETEWRGGGDCEDLAIWLYTRLLETGVQDVRFCIGVRSPAENALHCWVLWHDQGEPHVLDPTSGRGVARTAALPNGAYRPFYSYDAARRYAHTPGATMGG